jgi:hypothetical protein
MATSLARAAGVMRALRDAKWGLFDGVARLDDERVGEAQGLIKALKEALVSDEYVTDLEHHLDAAETKAIRLLAPRKRDDPDEDRERERKPDEKRKVWRPIERGRMTIAPESWDDEAARLASLLKDGAGRLRLVLNWSLEREEETS